MVSQSAIAAVNIDLLKKLYAAFNARDLDASLAGMHADVVWPNGMDGGVVHGHDGVRQYWTRQWAMIDPHVEPVNFKVDDAGDVVTSVHQSVRDFSGKVLLDRMVEHVYTFEDGLIRRMKIRE
jgi:hypothetical protein